MANNLESLLLDIREMKERDRETDTVSTIFSSIMSFRNLSHELLRRFSFVMLESKNKR
jgi:hypothetical protein